MTLTARERRVAQFLLWHGRAGLDELAPLFASGGRRRPERARRAAAALVVKGLAACGPSLKWIELDRARYLELQARSGRWIDGELGVAPKTPGQPQTVLGSPKRFWAAPKVLGRTAGESGGLTAETKGSAGHDDMMTCDMKRGGSIHVTCNESELKRLHVTCKTLDDVFETEAGPKRGHELLKAVRRMAPGLEPEFLAQWEARILKENAGAVWRAAQGARECRRWIRNPAAWMNRTYLKLVMKK